MRRIANLNGSSSESLIEQQREVMDAVEVLIEKMSLAFPHGRDYQINKDSAGDYSKDREEWEAKILLANSIKSYAFDTALNLVDRKMDGG